MRVYGEVVVWLHHSWFRCETKVRGQISALFVLPQGEKAPVTHWRGGWVGPRNGLDAVELSLSYGRRSADQFVLVSGHPLGPMTRFYPYPFFSDNCFVVLPVGRPLWREDGSVTHSADWSCHWGLRLCGGCPCREPNLGRVARRCTDLATQASYYVLKWH
jgi:hypothetical protein